MSEFEFDRFRKLKGPALRIWQGLLLLIPICGIMYILSLPVYFRVEVFAEQYIGLFFALILGCLYIGVPAGPGAPRDRVPWYDWVLAVAGMIVGLYLTLYFPTIVNTIGYVTPQRVILGSLMVILVLEALRRLSGWALVVVVLVFLGYAFVAPYMPGPLRGLASNFSDLANYLYLDPASTLRMIEIGGTIALAFILYGQILLAFGGGELLNDISLSLFGRLRGGPAKAAVVGSSLVGTVTGGPVTNVMLTGTVTIPLMIRTGYTPVMAGAVEAVASSGGQIMPPVMGIAAFLIADYLGVPYVQVAIAAFVPALLYYICLFSQVDLMAARDGMRGLPASEIPSLRHMIKNGWVILPVLGVLIYTIVILRLDPATAGVMSALMAVPVLLVRRQVRDRVFSRFLGALMETGRSMIEIAIVLAAAGIIVAVTNATGLGFNMALALTKLGGHSLALLLVVSAIVCVILGMGMPSVAAYTLVAVLVGPAIIQMGVVPLAAHLFIFYFAIVSNFTPPVALACFAAAPIAKASPHRIGYTAMRLGIVAYVVPFLFVYSPTLILKGETLHIVVSAATAVLGTWLLATALVGFMFRSVGMVQRIVLTVAALALLLPTDNQVGIASIVNIVGFVVAAAIVLANWRSRSIAPIPSAAVNGAANHRG